MDLGYSHFVLGGGGQKTQTPGSGAEDVCGEAGGEVGSLLGVGVPGPDRGEDALVLELRLRLLRRDENQ